MAIRTRRRDDRLVTDAHRVVELHEAAPCPRLGKTDKRLALDAELDALLDLLFGQGQHRGGRVEDLRPRHPVVAEHANVRSGSGIDRKYAGRACGCARESAKDDASEIVGIRRVAVDDLVLEITLLVEVVVIEVGEERRPLNFVPQGFVDVVIQVVDEAVAVRVDEDADRPQLGRLSGARRAGFVTRAAANKPGGNTAKEQSHSRNIHDFSWERPRNTHSRRGARTLRLNANRTPSGSHLRDVSLPLFLSVPAARGLTRTAMRALGVESRACRQNCGTKAA